MLKKLKIKIDHDKKIITSAIDRYREKQLHYSDGTIGYMKGGEISVSIPKKNEQTKLKKTISQNIR